jgi:MbtH protein
MCHSSTKKGVIVANPFDDEDGTFLALINEEGQYSLWPAFAEVPAGWTVAHEADTRRACLDFIEKSWTDMRPKSLIEEMQQYQRTS